MLLNCNIGIDLVYMPRFVDKITNQAFLKRVLTTEELKLFNSLKATRRKLEFLCGRYACKEAYSKALKLGIGKIDFHDFEILKDENNVPVTNKRNIELSISHDEDYTIAVVMVGESSE